MATVNNTLVGIAGVHYVASELSRRGLVALPTIKNIAAYDIVVVNMQGTRHANVQVKASSKRVNFFPMPPPDKVRTGARDVYVFVRWIEREQRYQGFLLSGRQARAAVEDRVRLQAPSIRRGTRTNPFPCVYVGPGNAANAKKMGAGLAQLDNLVMHSAVHATSRHGRRQS